MTIIPSDFPGKSSRGSYVYVIAFSSGVIKVGLTNDAASRISQHAKEGQRHSIRIVDAWVSEPHGQTQDNEKALIRFCEKHGTKVAGNEYFRGIAFQRVVNFALTLEFADHVPEEGSTQPGWIRAFMNSFGRRIGLPPRPEHKYRYAEGEEPTDLKAWADTILRLPQSLIERLDSDDFTAVRTNAIDATHAMEEVADLQLWLEEALGRRDTALLDDAYALRAAIAGRHEFADLPERGRANAESAKRFRREAREEEELSPLERLYRYMERFSHERILEFQQLHAVSGSAPDCRFQMVGLDGSPRGTFATIFTRPDGTYFARADAVAEAMGLKSNDLFLVHEATEDEFEVILGANESRGVYIVELMTSAGVERIARSAGFKVLEEADAAPQATVVHLPRQSRGGDAS